MTCLLDTHYMLWTVANTKKLSKEIKEMITDPENTIVVSTISFWEVSLKYALGKIIITGFLPEDLPDACAQMGFFIEPLSPFDSSRYHQLTAGYHKDPFDKMLIWQAIRNNYTLISNDSQIEQYVSEGLQLISGRAS